VPALEQLQPRHGRLDALPLSDSERAASPARVADPAQLGALAEVSDMRVLTVKQDAAADA
jgi:hypothetical protein